MRFFKSIGFVFRNLFDFRVNQWLGFQYIAKNFTQITTAIKSLVTPEQAILKEDFDQATQRLQLNERDLKNREQQFSRNLAIYLLLALLLFCYSLYMVLAKGNSLGALLSFALTIYSLTLAFRYHFWLYQLKRKQLGCTLKEWLKSK